MADISRVRIEWNGLGGLPGLSTFYTGVTTNVVVTSLTTFFNDIRSLFPQGLSWTIPNAGDTIESSTGILTGGWTGTGGGTVNANAPLGAYAAGTGARVRWHTTAVVNGRRLAGATFLCPLAGTKYDANGTIETGALATLQTAANALVASGNPWQVWHRPVGGTGGVVDAFNSATVLDRVSSLRSRRI